MTAMTAGFWTFRKVLSGCAYWIGVLFFGGIRVDAASWWAQPIEVHEWGVHGYDWSEEGQVWPEFPPYMYTPEKPGKPLSHPVVKQGKRALPLRVKDMAPDSGIRYKPVLYFYPPGFWQEKREGGKVVREKVYHRAAPIGVEMRFQYGDACAWYPQVSIFRDPGITSKASAPDWDRWRRKHGFQNFPDGFGRRFYRPHIMSLKVLKPPVVPDDLRFELVWDRLMLNPQSSGQNKIIVDYAGKDLPSSHWTKTARQVDAAVVSNGREFEKYLFYEGITREEPAIAVVSGGRLLVNVSKHPIYDVYLIYIKDGRKYVKYQSSLPPGSGGMLAGVPIKGLYPSQLPVVSIPDWDREVPLDEASFIRATSQRLHDNMIHGTEFQYANQIRDPADPQGPTLSHRLYPKEATVVEKVWRDAFFNKEGLTILYRESPAYLDEAMPIHIYTDMYHYIKLNRCGWVVNHHVDPKVASQVEKRLYSLVNPKLEPEKRAELLDSIKRHRIYARALLKFNSQVFNQKKRAELLKLFAE